MTRQATFLGPGSWRWRLSLVVPWKRKPWRGPSQRLVATSTIESLARALCASLAKFIGNNLTGHYCLQQPHSLPSQPCDDINPLMPPILTGYALHITELDVESRTHFDKGTPSNFGRFAVIRLDHGNTRQSGNSLRRRVLSSHLSSSVQDAGIFFR